MFSHLFGTCQALTLNISLSGDKLTVQQSHSPLGLITLPSPNFAVMAPGILISTVS